MSNQKKKQSFIEEAMYQLTTCVANYGVDVDRLGEFEKLAVGLLKQSFKNGLKAGYTKAKNETAAKGTQQ